MNSEVESELCRYSGYLCHRDKLKHFDFCLRHILEDKTAPFKQCTYNIKSQKRCLRPAPRADKKDGYCAEHARKALINRHKLLARKSYVGLYSRCLSDLSHYVKGDGNQVESDVKTEDVPSAKRPCLESGQDEQKPPLQVVSGNPYDLLTRVKPQFGDEEELKEEEEEELRVDQTWKGDGESDAESLDSEQDSPLRHAGVYAPEEVVRIMRDKLIRLQKSYIDQFQRLQYLLREERRRYKHAVQKEKESLMSIHLQPKESESERSAYRLIKSLNHYNLRQGKDALLALKVKEKRRRATEGLASVAAASSPGPKCTFNITSHIKCCEPCIPLSKFCLKHIFQDSSQVLFRRCGFVTPADEEPCEAPVANTFDDATCIYHSYLPPLNVSKYKSDSPGPEPKEENWIMPSVKVELRDIALTPIPDISSKEKHWNKGDGGSTVKEENALQEDIKPPEESQIQEQDGQLP